MKKFISLMLVLILIVSLFLVGCEKEKKNQNIRLVEVTHSVFYAPQYVAIEKGFF
jgi:NitT/TauT family transport system substrate-binding protein